MNRTTYKFNDKLDKAILRPLARGYQQGHAGFCADRRAQLHGQPELFDRHAQRPAAGSDQAVLLRHPAAGRQHDHRHRRAVRSGDPHGASTRTTATWDRRSASGASAAGRTWCCRSSGLRTCAMPSAASAMTSARRASTSATPTGTTACGRSMCWTRARGCCRCDRVLDSAYDPYAFLRNAYLQRPRFQGERRAVGERGGAGAEAVRGEPAMKGPQRPAHRPKGTTAPGRTAAPQRHRLKRAHRPPRLLAATRAAEPAPAAAATLARAHTPRASSSSTSLMRPSAVRSCGRCV